MHSTPKRVRMPAYANLNILAFATPADQPRTSDQVHPSVIPRSIWPPHNYSLDLMKPISTPGRRTVRFLRPSLLSSTVSVEGCVAFQTRHRTAIPSAQNRERPRNWVSERVSATSNEMRLA
jgi:hypothetical protein